MNSGGVNRAIVRGLCWAAFLFAGTARGAEAEAFVGNWVNINSRTTGLTRVDIGIFKNTFTIHAWRACSPTPCDLGTITTPIPLPLGDTFTVAYELPKVITTLRITLVGPNSLTIHTRVDVLGSRTEYDDYFYREGGRVLPDLVVSGLSIPKPVVVYGALPRTDVTMTIKNIGPGILPSGSYQARLSGQTRNGAPFVSSGYFSISLQQPLYPGQTATHSFAVGHDSGWPVGCYSIRILVDSNQGVDEANDKNNLSQVLSFDVANERFLSGTIEYGGQPLTNFTQIAPTTVWIRDELFNQILSDYFFWYNPQTGHYLISGLPAREVFVSIAFRLSGPADHLAGNYECSDYVNPGALTEAQASAYDIPAWKILHLLEPQDNSQPLEDSDAYWQCAGDGFAWEALPLATTYKIDIKTYRDPSHPSGYGFVANTLYHETPDVSLAPNLPPLADMHHYQMYLAGYNAADEMLGRYEFSIFVPGAIGFGSGSDYRFKVCASCARSDLNRDCEVSLPDFAILAEDWLTNTK